MTRTLVALAAVLTLLSGGTAYAAGLPPPTGTDVDYQLGGNRSVPANVGIVVRDRNAAPAADRYNVCYVNGFQTQPDERGFWRYHATLLLRKDGVPVVDEGWGEILLDTRKAYKRAALAKLVGRWVDGCAASGYDAVEFDNLDSWSRSRGLIQRDHNRAYARLLVAEAHEAGLAAGQKNWAEWDGRVVGFDFAVAEECGRWRECGDYVASYGNRVLVIEYRRVDFEAACQGWASRLAIVLRDLDLSPTGVRAWC